MDITHVAVAGAGSGIGGLINGTDWNQGHALVGPVLAPSFVGGGQLSGQYYSTTRGSAQSTSGRTMVANDFSLNSFIAPCDLTADRLAQRVVTGNGNIKLCIYDGDNSGWPGTLLFESASLSAASNNTTVEATISQTFKAGRQYWLGVRTSGTPSIASYNSGNQLQIHLFGSDPASSPRTMIQRTLTFATAAPNPFALVAADLSTFNVPAVSVRAT